MEGTKHPHYESLDRTSSAHASELRDAALSYHDLGLTPIPCNRDDKTPAIRWSRWQQERPTQRQIIQWFEEGGRNIALVCGLSSQNMFVLDCDSKDSFEQTEKHLATLHISTWVVQRPANGGES